jgi:DNA polymerase-3 subunit gamma/tau
MARIFAKALNGGDPEVDQAIMEGRDTDVIEIDAASNRGVEDARELIANSVYRPLRGQYKIYIIDEVHMLTSQAFNTLLKVMEEPPEHVKFILATTEPHKVLATIQSRCQRFDFRNISSTEIARHLGEVVERESLKAEPEVLLEIARLANGSMRDGLSLLDRLIAAVPPGESLTTTILEHVLGLPERVLIAGLLEAVADGDPAKALERTAVLLERGSDQDQMLDALIFQLRNLMVICACGADSPLVELSGEARDGAAKQAQRFDAAGLVHLIALVEAVKRNARNSSTARALIDAMVVRMAMSEQIADVGRLLAEGGLPAKKR